MKVSYTGKSAPVDGHGVNIQFNVDGALLNCYVSHEALQDIDPAPQQASASELFERNQTTTLALAEKKIRSVLPLKILKEDVAQSA